MLEKSRSKNEKPYFATLILKIRENVKTNPNH
jgi:hypothetical protein